MFLDAKVLLVVLASAFAAQAQTATMSAPSSTPTVDSCITDCVSLAASTAGCFTYTNITCVCTTSEFQQVAATCLQANCNAADIATAEALQASECAAFTTTPGTSSATATAASGGASASGSSGGASASGSSGASGSSSGSAASTATHSSAALAFSAPLSFGTLVATLVASTGALVGATLVF